MLKTFGFAANKAAAIVITIAAMALPAASSADNVRLYAHDGSTRISGDLVDYQNASYQIDTVLGRLSISAVFVGCDGATCPSAERVLSDIQGFMLPSPAVIDPAFAPVERISSACTIVHAAALHSRDC